MNVESPLLREVRELRLLAQGLSQVEAFPTDLLDLMLEKIGRLEVLLAGAPLEAFNPITPAGLGFAEPAIPDPAIPDPAIPDPVIPDPVIPEPAIPEPALDEPTLRLERIRVSLTLNDRFLFQRELFGGDPKQMTSFFDVLSQCSNRTEAEALLHTHCVGREQSEGFGIMKALLERWFPAHAGLV